jgi:anti-anti-sigma factor
VSDSHSTADCSVRGSTLIAKIKLAELRDTDAIQQLKDDLLAAVTLAKPRNVVLDLSQVRFVGSVGFLVFLRIRREPGVGRIVLCNLGEQVRGAFVICRLLPNETNRLAPFEEAGSVEEALAKCVK